MASTIRDVAVDIDEAFAREGRVSKTREIGSSIHHDSGDSIESIQVDGAQEAAAANESSGPRSALVVCIDREEDAVPVVGEVAGLKESIDHVSREGSVLSATPDSLSLAHEVAPGCSSLHAISLTWITARHTVGSSARSNRPP